MGIYNFSFDQRTSSPPGAVEQHPQLLPIINLPDRTGHKNIIYDKVNVNVEDVKTVLQKGFFAFDEAIKNWLSDLEVPTKDGMKRLTVRVPRGDRTVLVWQQDLKEGRVILPVASLVRSSETFHAEKFSPPYRHIRRRFVDSARSRLALTYRPRHFIAEYQVSIWTEFKEDAEYILYQLLTRFSPLAEIRVSDSYIEGNVQMKFGTATDNSDLETTKDSIAKVRYDVTMSAEVWLPIAEKLVPAIRGDVAALQDMTGEIISVNMGVISTPTS
jgi:hypothetical protein